MTRSVARSHPPYGKRRLILPRSSPIRMATASCSISSQTQMRKALDLEVQYAARRAGNATVTALTSKQISWPEQCIF